MAVPGKIAGHIAVNLGYVPRNKTNLKMLVCLIGNLARFNAKENEI